MQKNILKNFIKNYWKTTLATAVICYLCFAPPKTFDGAPVLFPHADKLVHFFMFFVLAITVYVDYQRNTYSQPKATKILFCWCFPVLFGLAIEGIQHFLLPLRSGDLMDWFFDCVGYIHGFVLTTIFFKIKIKTNGTKN